jgi:hypothetical protein
MKKINTLILHIGLIFVFFHVPAMAQDFLWAKRAGSYAIDEGNGICTDEHGNVFVTGQYEYTADFGPFTFSTSGKTGDHNIFVAKYSPEGIPLWVRSAGGEGGDDGKGICVDKDGFVYVTGEIEGPTADFDHITVSASNNVNDTFIAKYSPDGTIIWVKVATGQNRNKGRGITVDSKGDVYITGDFESYISFSNTIGFASNGNKDIFTAKYSTNGNFIWAKRGGGAGADQGSAISTDENGNVYVTGYFAETATFSGSSISSGGGLDIFIAKYSQSGDLIFLKSAGGSNYNLGRGIMVGNNNRFYLCGSFVNKAFFDNIQITSSGKADAFLACYDLDGTAQWVKKAGGRHEDRAYGITLDPENNVYITGDFDTTATFSGSEISSKDTIDAFVASYTSDGDLRWVTKMGGKSVDHGIGIAVDFNANVYITGFFKEDFTAGSFPLTAKGHSDIFIVKIKSNDNSVINTPSSPASNLDASVINCNQIQLSWTNGNGSNRLVIGRATDPVDAMPIDGVHYSSNSTFGSGANLGNGNFVVYRGTGNNVTVKNLSPGTYHFAVFEFNGSGSSTKYFTTGYPFISENIGHYNQANIGSDTLVCMPDQLILDAGAGFTSYEWNNGSNSQSIIADTSGVGLGTFTYSVTVTDNNGCTSTSSISITYDLCAGGNENIVAEEISIFPNPANENFYLNLGNGNNRLIIYNSIGMVVFDQTMHINNEVQKNISISDLAEGLYIVRIQNNFKEQSKKLIIRR